MSDQLYAVVSLFDECPLPGCRNPVPDPRTPCDECLTVFGDDYLRPAGREVTAEEFAAELAARDKAVAAHLAARRRMLAEAAQ